MFLSSNYKEFYEQVEKAYTDEYMKEILDKLKITNEHHKDIFIKSVRQASLEYLNAIYLNSKRISPYQQRDILLEYAESLKVVQNKYKQVVNHSTTRGKLGKSLSRILENTDEAGMKEMFHPYVDKDQKSMAITLFDKFISLLIDAAETAPTENIGSDKKNLKGNFTAFWVAYIRSGWTACSDVPFAHGKSYKEIGDTTNICPEILYELFSKIEPSTTKQRIKTALRKVIKTELNTPVTDFLS